ncbi:hypothetical protein [Burkholderia cenocepacia]|uniref:hypothetical protein n=1 Tax=Burkholderia cenocepacia TaxID=95486 RepID=UPI00222E5050|nr:hypothetical protein [Burkholderia cenocepacia]MCW3677846.1 hypothetical protein [Burkholderia cenocepacia]
MRKFRGTNFSSQLRATKKRSVAAACRVAHGAVEFARTVRAAQSALSRKATTAYLVGITLLTAPLYAHAGIWSGGLCRAYQNIVDDELKSIVSLVALAAAIIIWLMDDGKSNIKIWVLRGIAGTLTLFNLPIIWALVMNRSLTCTG